MDGHVAPPNRYLVRLALLAVLMLCVPVVLAARLVDLTIDRGDEMLARARSVLTAEEFLPTRRGSILDRDGRILARDEPGWAVALHYDLIGDRWLDRRARSLAKEGLGADVWETLSAGDRRSAAAAARIDAAAERAGLLRAIAEATATDLADLQARIADRRAFVARLRDHVHHAQRDLALDRHLDEGRRLKDFSFAAGPIREEQRPYVVIDDLDDEAALLVRRIADANPAWSEMIRVPDARRRTYPWREQQVEVDRSVFPRAIRSDTPAYVALEHVADHLLGGMRPAQQPDVEARPFRRGDGETDLRGYRDGDRTGGRGIERIFERELRGARGWVRRDAATGGEIERVEHAPGRDVRVSLDIELQARLEALLRPEVGLAVVQPWHENPFLRTGRPLDGAIVVLDVETGEVLASASRPTFFEGIERAREMDDAEAWAKGPLVERAISGFYDPGSIVKPLTLVAAATEGLVAPGEEIECTGHFYEGAPNSARCWIFRPRWDFQTHGDLGPSEAIARSCNIYFYELAERLGLERIERWYGRFGVGRELLEGGIGHRGATPDPARIRASGSPAYGTIILGIGQGGVGWTPLHAAAAYATLARGGVDVGTTLLAGRGGRRPEPVDLGPPAWAVDAALEGLRRSVSERYGTSHHLRHPDGTIEPLFTCPSVVVWGKTGTAQTSWGGLVNDPWVVPTPEGEARPAPPTHAWFTGLVGPEDVGRPKYAIAVLLEYGGSGGRAAGPVANAVIRALQHAGYLPGADLPPTDGGAS